MNNSNPVGPTRTEKLRTPQSGPICPRPPTQASSNLSSYNTHLIQEVCVIYKNYRIIHTHLMKHGPWRDFLNTQKKLLERCGRVQCDPPFPSTELGCPPPTDAPARVLWVNIQGITHAVSTVTCY